jgi:hypothetical protein
VGSTGATSADSASTKAKISGNGNYVVFESIATDILAPPGTNGSKHIYVRDLTVPLDIVRVNNPVSGSEATASSDRPVISDDGRYTAFDSIEKFTLDDSDGTLDVYRAYNSSYQ